MIFVTVGTHEQPFNRLVMCMDNWAREHKEKVIIQTGFSTYIPKYCEYYKFLKYCEMSKYIEQARIVITHGGPSSFISPLQIGKKPIIVPRKREFNEHVNDHQVNFVKNVKNRIGSIIVVENIDKLPSIVDQYDEIIAGMTNQFKSNNSNFCKSLCSLVDDMFITDL